MAVTNTEVHKRLVEIRDLISAILDRPATIVAKGGKFSLKNLESQLSALSTQLSNQHITIDTNTDDLETKLDTLSTKLDTLGGYVDQLEGYVDGIESLLQDIDNNTDGIESRLTTANNWLQDIQDAVEELQLTGIVFLELVAIYTRLGDIEDATDENTAKVDDLIVDTKNLYRRYVYSGTWTATSIANFRVQFLANENMNLRVFRAVRTTGASTPVLNLIIYNSDVGRDVNYTTSAAASDHQLKELNIPIPEAWSLRVDLGLAVTGDVYKIDAIFDINGVDKPAISTYGAAFTRTDQVDDTRW